MNGSINYSVSMATSAAAAALAAFTSKITSVGRLASGAFAGMAAPVTGLVKGIGALNQAMEGVGRLISPLGAVKDGLLSSVVAAAKMEKTKTAFEVMIGSAEKAAKTLAELKKLAADTPFELPEITDAGQLLLNFNVKAEDLTDTLRRLGDVSAVRNNLSQVAMIFGQVKAKTKLAGDELMQFAEAGVPMLSELAKMLGTDESHITKLSEAGQIGFPLVNQAFSNMTAEGGQFFGMMQKQSGTTEGIWSNLQAAIGELQEKLGTPINDALRPLLNDVIALAETLKPKMEAIGNAIKEWMNYIRGAFSQGFGFEAMLAPLKLGLLEAANDFAKMMAKAFDDLKLKTAAFNPMISGDELTQMAKDGRQTQDGPGPLAGRIDMKERIAEMHRLTAAQEADRVATAAHQKALAEFEKSLDETVKGPAKPTLLDGVKDAMAKAKDALKQIDNPDGDKKTRAMLDYTRQVEIATLKLKGMNKEATALEKETKLREKIAEIMTKTGVSYEKAAEAAKKLTAAENTQAPARRSAAQVVEDRRAANRNALDLRRQAHKEEIEAGNRAGAAARGMNAIDWLKDKNKASLIPAAKVETKFPGLDWLEKGNSRVQKALAPPAQKMTETGKLIASVDGILDFFTKKVAAV